MSTRTPGPAGKRERGDPPGRGPEILVRILGIDPDFDRGTTHRNVGLDEFERMALRDRYRGAHEIDPRDHFGHRMLDLDACVHFDEEELAGVFVVEVFERSRRRDISTRSASRTAEAHSASPRGVIDRRGRRLLPDLLAAPLQRAFALETVHDILTVAQHLHLEMARAA